MPIHKPTPPLSFRPAALSSLQTFAEAVADPRLGAYLHARLDPYGIPDADKDDIAAAVKDGLWRCRRDADPACTMPRIFGLASLIVK